MNPPDLQTGMYILQVLYNRSDDYKTADKERIDNLIAYPAPVSIRTKIESRKTDYKFPSKKIPPKRD